MLRLEGLSVAGFKSFVDRTDLTFPDGITCVVGPNGCGKSNVVDAVSWVLGEQSAKTLRGSRMEDVIFAGSRGRKPSGLAEVTLRFHPRSELVELAASDEEVDPRLAEPLSLTRRLYRNGDSEYLINGERARLKDIVSLIRGTGMGTRVYSIIEQGRVDQILNSKPTDRRILIEEAAGITGYRVKRRSAQLKLDESERSLERVTDIIAELEKQLRSLKRQASTARRYRRLAGRQRVVLRALLAVQHARLSEELAAVEAELTTLAAAEEETAAQLAELDESSRAAREKVSAIEERRDDALRQSHQLELELDRARGVIQASRDRIAENEEREARAVETRKRVAAGSEELERRRDACRAQLDRLEGDLADSESVVAAQESAAREVKDELAAAHGRIADSKESIFEIMSEASGLRNARQEVESSLERLRRQVHRLEQVVADGARERSSIEEQLRDCRGALVRAQSREADLRTASSEAEGRREAIRERLREVRERSDALSRRLRDVEGHRAAVRETVRSRAAYAEGVRRFLAGSPRGALGTVADFVRVDSGDEPAVEKAFAGALQAVVFETREAAEAAVQELAAKSGGEVSVVFPGAEPVGSSASSPPVDDRVLGDVRDRVRFEGPAAAWLPTVLGPACLVDVSATALELSRESPSTTFVSRDGALVGPGGRATAGRALAEGSGILETRTRLEQLDELAATLAEEERGLVAARAELEASADDVAQELTELQAERAEVEKDIVGRRQELSSLEQGLTAAESRHAAAQGEHEAVAAELRDAEGRIAEFARRLEDCAARRAKMEAVLKEADVRAQALEDDALDADADLSRLREERAVKGERREAARTDLEKADAEVAAVRGRIDELDAEVQELSRQRAEAAALIERMEAALVAGAERSRELGEELRRAEELVSTGRTELVTGAEQLRDLRLEHDRRAKAASAVRVRRERLLSDLEHLRADCRKELGVEAADLPQPTPPADPDATATEGRADAADAAADAGPGSESAVDVEEAEHPLEVVVIDESLPWAEDALDVEALEREAEELRDRLSRIGPVNLVAIEEYEELAERHGFLAKERDDLVESIEGLRRTIGEIDELSRRLFLEAFESVRQTFDRAFQTLFRGGRAELRLQEDVDPLEAGIEIIAQPPGKRLQNMMLLSGGEKALSAIALLFALFRYKPSPFCILDEVDAPLDEANVQRFVDLVEELAADTQFVVITHNRRTMERGDVLYGVTMEEPGCSKLVAVRFEGLRATA